MNQLSIGVILKMINMTIDILRAALKLLVLIFLFRLSNSFIPENSILMK